MQNNLFLDKGNDINSISLSKGMKISDKDNFLKKYDTNGNSVWDAEEIQAFMDDLYQADSNGDGKIDNNESVAWYAKIFNTSVNNLKSKFQTNNNNEVYNSLSNIIKENAISNSVSRINKNADEALDIYNSSIGGIISKTGNSVKEFFNTKYAGSKVYRQLAKQKVSGMLLESAHLNDGLTAKEYLGEKINLLKSLLGSDNLSKSEQNTLENSIMDMDFQELDTLIIRLANVDDKDYENLKAKTIKGLLSTSNTKQPKDIVGFKRISKNPSSVGSFINSANSSRKMSFEQIFEKEMGLPFNADAINKYENQYKTTYSLITAHNKVSKISEDLEKNISAMDGYNNFGNTTGLSNEKEILYKNLSNSILSALQEFYGHDEDKINEILAEYNAKLENGKISFEATSVQDISIVNLAKSLKNKFQSNLSKLMDGKSLEDYQNSLKSSYENAYGLKNSIDLASKFQESQQECIDIAKIGVSTSGVLIAVLSDGTLLPVTGMLLGTFGSGLVSEAEALTKDGGMTKDDAKEIAKEFATSGILTLIGMKEGEIAAKIGHTLMKSCPKFLQYLSEYGSMAVMGALTDFAVMGEIDLTQESISNLINIASGIIAHKKITKSKSNNPDIVNENTAKNIQKEPPQNIAKKNTIINEQPSNNVHNENTVKDTSNTNPKVEETKKLLNKDLQKWCPPEDIELLNNTLEKYPQYKKEILSIVNSNNNIRFGKNLANQQAPDIDNIVKTIESNPKYKKEIVDYMQVQRRANNDVSDPTASLNAYIQTLEKYPQYHDFITELSKNGNLDAKSIDGGINTIETALNLHAKFNFSVDDILALSNQGYDVAQIRNNLSLVKEHPEMRNTILNDVPEFQLIDKTPAKTPKAIIQKRFDIQDMLNRNFPKEIKELKQTLGDDFFYKVKWEEIIPENINTNDIKQILDNLNNSSKFFARITANEINYGKNIKWASKMNDISNGASTLIKNGKDFDSVLNFISNQYQGYDIATTLATNRPEPTDRRIHSGHYRGFDRADGYARTPFDNQDGYNEYFDRFSKIEGVRKPPYDDIELTQIVNGRIYGYENQGNMLHPANKFVEPGMQHIREKYEELKPFFDKVKNGGTLSKQDLKLVNDSVSEIYFLMANIMPYDRGSNGISDILMRSIYKNLGINQPALKHGVSLDLEAFCMDLNEYKKKWTSFFESN